MTRAFFAALFVCLATSGCTGPAEDSRETSPTDLPASDWNVGDHWDWRLVGGRFEQRIEVASVEQRQGVAAHRLVTVATDAGQPAYSARSESWHRHPDHAQLEVRSVTQAAGKEPTYDNSTMEPPCIGYWAYAGRAVGETWQEDCSYVRAGATARDIVRSYYVVDEVVNVTVIAGTFPATKLLVTPSTNHAPSTVWMSPEACGPVRIAYHYAHDESVMELASFRCGQS